LRHWLATEMLRAGASLPEVGQVLRHRGQLATSVYAKVDNTEERILRTTPVTTATPINFPHAAQVFRVVRYVGGLGGQRRSKEVAHCVTSLTPDKADAVGLENSMQGPDLRSSRGAWAWMIVGCYCRSCIGSALSARSDRGADAARPEQ
jgi:hypothetical protein